MMNNTASRAGTPTPASLSNTISLVERARSGDASARDLLFERAMPPLCRWARGRLPRWARDLNDTQDLVQDTVLHTLGRLDVFEVRRPGALNAYLRRSITNRIRDEIRRVASRPFLIDACDRLATTTPSPLRQAMETEGMVKYKKALLRLRPADRQAIILRLERHLSYEQGALALKKPSAAAARMAVSRALASLIKVMNHAG